MTEFVQIGALARAAGVSVDTLRYYERLGLLDPAHRTPAGYRVYAASAVGELSFIKAAQGVGLSLEEIARLRATAAAGELDLAGVRALLRRKIAMIDGQMQRLKQGRRELTRLLEQLQCADAQPVSQEALRRAGRSQGTSAGAGERG